MRSLFCGSADAAAAVSGKVVEPSVERRVCCASLVSTFLLHRCLPDCQVSVAVEMLSPPTLHFPPRLKTVVEDKDKELQLQDTTAAVFQQTLRPIPGIVADISIVSRHY